MCISNFQPLQLYQNLRTAHFPLISSDVHIEMKCYRQLRMEWLYTNAMDTYLYTHTHIYIYREREVDKSVSLQRWIAFSAAALIFCCKARFGCRYDSKSNCTRKMAASQSRTVHSKTHRVCPIRTRNIGPIGPLSSTIPSPWIESLPKGRSHMPCMIQRATVPGKRLRPNHVRCIPRPTGSVLST